MIERQPEQTHLAELDEGFHRFSPPVDRTPSEPDPVELELRRDDATLPLFETPPPPY